MKRFQRICALFLLITCLGLPVLRAQSYDKLWKQVEQAQEKSLPQTVIKLTGEIYRKAEKEKNAPQMLKATVCRDTYQESLTPDSLYTNLKNMELWAQTEQNPVNKAILNSLLAQEYADYMRSNRSALLSRTSLELDEAPADIREWSANLFIDRIDRYNRASLQDSARLLEVSSREYVPFVVLEDGSRFYQHDMYHLLASRAISTYQDLNGFRVDSLMNMRITGIYENMINAYRLHSGSEDAVLLCTLDYWKWKTANSIGRATSPAYNGRNGQINEEYLKTLDNLINLYGSREVCAEVYINKAEYLRSPGVNRLAEALKVCDEGVKRYPSYKRINELKNIRESIVQPYLTIGTLGSIYPGDSLDLSMRYRNLEGVTLNLYRTDLPEVPWMDTGINKAFYQKHARKLSSVHFALRPLPKEGVSSEDIPYQYSDSTLKMYIPDEPGVYILQAVPDVENARTADHFLVSTRFKVLTLSLPGNKMEVVTLDGHSGQPIPGAKVSFYSTYDEKDRKELLTVTTAADGKALVEWNKSIRSYVARKGEDVAMLPQNVYSNQYYERTESRPEEHVTLLTDRALYRPGQTVYVKGIAYEQAADTAHVLAGKSYHIRLQDVNGKELVQKEVKTNDFGSFTTEFILPTVCLNGNFTISVRNGSSVFVRVEEYKRPTFDITFNPVKQAYSLGDTVTVTGNVKSYNGVAVQDVPLVYTVTRRNYWRGWGEQPAPLASDTIQLNVNGDFSIPVILKPGVNAGLSRGERFSYQIDAVVTDEAGETQSAQYSLSAAQQAYFFTADIKRELCKDDSITARLSVNNAVNQVLTMDGVCRLYPVIDSKTGKIADKPVYESSFKSGEEKDFSSWKQLPSGEYRFIMSVRDRNGKEVSNEDNKVTVILFALADPKPAVFMETFLYEKNTMFDAAHPAVFYFGTSYKDAYILVDVFGRKGRIESRTLSLSDSILRMEYPYKEEYGDGIAVQLTFVKNGQSYARRVELLKRQPDRTLDMKWEVFRDRLRPGQQEEWKLVIKTPQGFPAVAEMLATMYDASLDQIYRRNQSLDVYFNRYVPYFYWNISNTPGMVYSPDFPRKSWKVPAWNFDYFYSSYGTPEMSYFNGVTVIGYGTTRKNSATGNMMIRGAASKAAAVAQENGASIELKYVPVEASDEVKDVVFESEVVSVDNPTLQPVAELRTNFAETAFFYPQLRTNEQGEVAFSFTMPQSLTRWNFRGYSHTKNMMTGNLDATAVTAKEFMLTPNMPRFVRVGDKTQIAAGIANLTGKPVKGTAILALFDPMTEKVISTLREKFSVEAGRTTSVNFRFDVTDRYDLLGVRMIADGGSFSDGEQHLLPVLSNKEYITETLAMPIRGEQTRTFSLDSLFNGNSRTATDRRLTVEFTGNPAWYAVQSLPVLSQPTGDNAISWAAAFYANSLASFIANSQPRIKTVFDSWKAAGGTKETFLSQLQQNQDVKNILLDESPWLMEATTEAEQRARIATLFDINQLNNRNLAAFTKLKELQGEDGAWSWYKGMGGSRTITAYITELLVRLPLLTKAQLPDEAIEMKQKAFGFLQQQALEEYRAIRKAEKNGTKITTLSDATMEYLYLVAIGRETLSGDNLTAFDYFLTKLNRNLENGTMLCKAQTAIILWSVGRKSEANEFIASLKEHLVQTDEMGAHFAFHSTDYGWGMLLPVPVHVEVMEALRLVGGNETLVEEMRLWLLKQKQTTAWNSPVATADAVYALLCQGSNLLENRGDVRITLGNKVLETLSPAKTTVPGLGYIKDTFTQGSPELKAKSITVVKRDAGIAWGAVYAQYLSPVSDVKQQGGELNVEKKLYVERVAANGQKSLQPVTAATPLVVGDKVVSRLTISLDRAMDFVQLKDQRGACFEPVGTLSGYRWNNGLGYYVDVKDAATNFFFDHLGKGVYVLEHSYRIARGGTYETGLATIQCAYAPEYASHSKGGTVVIK